MAKNKYQKKRMTWEEYNKKKNKGKRKGKNKIHAQGAASAPYNVENTVTLEE